MMSKPQKIARLLLSRRRQASHGGRAGTANA